MNESDYSASNASSGSGFFGETPLLEEGINNNNDSLPSDALNTINLIGYYFENTLLDDDNMNKLSVTDKNYLKTVWQNKLKNNLNNLISNNKMSNYSYTILIDIFNALKTNKYDIANKKISEIAKNTKEFKQNRKWIMSFKSVTRILIKTS